MSDKTLPPRSLPYALPSWLGASSGNGRAQGSEAESEAARNPPSVGGQAASPVLRMRGFLVEGVSMHPDEGITPATMQAIADAGFARFADGKVDAELSFGQLQDVAAAITTAYREAGFIVSKAYLDRKSTRLNSSH